MISQNLKLSVICTLYIRRCFPLHNARMYFATDIFRIKVYCAGILAQSEKTLYIRNTENCACAPVLIQYHILANGQLV